jgi:hypothetical protein
LTSPAESPVVASPFPCAASLFLQHSVVILLP